MCDTGEGVCERYHSTRNDGSEMPHFLLDFVVRKVLKDSSVLRTVHAGSPN